MKFLNLEIINIGFPGSKCQKLTAMHPGGKAWKEDVSQQLDGGVRRPVGWGGGPGRLGRRSSVMGFGSVGPASWPLISCKHSAMILRAPVRMRRTEPRLQSQWESPLVEKVALLLDDYSRHQIQSFFPNPCESRTLMRSESYSWTLEWPEVYPKIFCSLLPTPGSSLLYFLNLCWRNNVTPDVSFRCFPSHGFMIFRREQLLYQKEGGSALWRGCQAAGSPRSFLWASPPFPLQPPLLPLPPQPGS